MPVTPDMLKGKTPEQQRVIKYFEDSGCFASLTGMKDEEYDSLLQKKINDLNPKKRALQRIGLDDDQLKEIPPVNLYGYHYGDEAHSKRGSDGRSRSSKYDVAWLFFSDTQVYLYTYVLDMAGDSKIERAEEFFYKDVVSFSTYSESTKVNVSGGCMGGGDQQATVEWESFQMSVTSGEKFRVSTTGVAGAEKSVSGMKQKLREKKN